MSKRDAKIELIRTHILMEIERVQAGTTAPGTAYALWRYGHIGGLRRALEILDKVDEEVA